MWLIRKLYGSGSHRGTGGILPPNDPRLEGLTDEQIELDITLYMADHPELKKQSEAYQDADYEQAMKADLGSAAPETQDTPPVNDWIDEPID